jgi:tripartite ATP-independent transporter DctM subunit
MPIAMGVFDVTLIAMEMQGMPSSIALSRFVSGSQSFLLTAVPFFTLAGVIMGEGGITKRIISFCLMLVGRVRGSLGHVNILASMIFGGISGSSVADTASLGCILIPEMEKNGYDSDYSAAVTAVSSTIGIVIPPSIPMILYSSVANVSIGKMFLAGAVPGVLIGIFQMIMNARIARRRKFPIYSTERVPVKTFFIGLKDSLLAIGMPLFIILSITFGVVTATEAAVLAVFYSFIVGKFVYKELDLKKMPEILLKTAETTAVVMFIVIGTAALGWLLGYAQIPQKISISLLGVSTNPIVILLIINVIMLVVGTVSDVAPNILILTPVFLPVIVSLGIDPVQFGIIMILNQAIALVSPPVGNCLYVCSNIGKVGIEKVFVSGLPFILANLCVLLLVVFFPNFALWLPNVMMG